MGAKLKFVITRLIFYEKVGVVDGSGPRSQAPLMANPIDSGGDSKKSLENVNYWNENLLASLPPDQRHDIAIW